MLAYLPGPDCMPPRTARERSEPQKRETVADNGDREATEEADTNEETSDGQRRDAHSED